MGAQVLNEVTGEAVLTDKVGREYHVLFDLTAVVATEKLTGRSVMDVLTGPHAADCLVMIVTGAAGYARRNPGAPNVNANLAQRIFIDSGGLVKAGPVLVQSLSCAEGLGLGADDEAGEADEAAPLVSPPS